MQTTCRARSCAATPCILVAVPGSAQECLCWQAQTGDSVPVPAAKRKPGRMQSQLATAALRPEARYFHSRSCMPMTREEAGADLDSDDEPDTEAWRVCIMALADAVLACR